MILTVTAKGKPCLDGSTDLILTRDCLFRIEFTAAYTDWTFQSFTSWYVCGSFKHKCRVSWAALKFIWSSHE